MPTTRFCLQKFLLEFLELFIFFPLKHCLHRPLPLKKSLFSCFLFLFLYLLLQFLLFLQLFLSSNSLLGVDCVVPTVFVTGFIVLVTFSIIVLFILFEYTNFLQVSLFDIRGIFPFLILFLIFLVKFFLLFLLF